MRPTACGLGVLMGFLVAAGSAWGGLYNPSADPEEERLEYSPDMVHKFWGRAADLRNLGLDLKTPPIPAMYRRYVLIDAASTAQSAKRLSLPEKISLAATYLRRRKFEEARELLENARGEAPDNILVLSNLALANHRSGLLSRANDHMRDLLRQHWPAQWTDLPETERAFLESVGWHQGMYEWNRKVDTYYARLVRLRLAESSKKIDPKDELPDALFADTSSPPQPVRFIGPSGKYEAGGIAPAEVAKLPQDAPEIVQQLLYWMPDDNRLFWLLGEVYNARGTPDDLRAAYLIFNKLLDPEGRQYHPDALAEHYNLIRERLASLPPPQRNLGVDEGPGKKATDIANNDDDRPAVDWRTAWIGFSAGFVVALFAFWQVRELRRRRQPRQPV